MLGRIVDIKRFAIHDGDGIRTTVFLKGCPLRCVWCHNPEGLKSETELGYYAEKCVGCGICTELCEANVIENGVHRFDRSKCTYCGKCTRLCPSDCFRIYGTPMSVDELFCEVSDDFEFFRESGGGITLSGGECLLQADFCREFLKKCKETDINTAVDTCGFVRRDNIDKVLPYTDTFLYDIKAIDEDVHIKCTGQPNGLILDNLQYLSECGAKIEIRYPCVEGYNTNQAEKIADFVLGLNGVSAVRLLPYHNLSGAKYDSISADNTMPDILPPSAELMSRIKDEFIRKGINVV